MCLCVFIRKHCPNNFLIGDQQPDDKTSVKDRVLCVNILFLVYCSYFNQVVDKFLLKFISTGNICEYMAWTDATQSIFSISYNLKSL